METAPDIPVIGTLGVTGAGVAYIPLQVAGGGLRGTRGFSFSVGGLGVMTGREPGRPLRQEVDAYRALFCIPAVGVGISGGVLISLKKSGVAGATTLAGQE